MWKEYSNFERQQDIFSTGEMDRECKNDWVVETTMQG